MSKQLVQFALILVACLGLAFGLHVLFFHFKNLIAPISLFTVTYLFNYLITVVFFGVLLFFKKKKSDQLGFVFMFSSVAKFLLFFALINPALQSPDISKSISFWAFFVPYAISLTLECIALVRILNQE